MARDNTENNFITIVPETASPVAKQSSSVPLLLLLSSLAPLANKLSCFVSMCVSSDKFISKCQARAHSWVLEGGSSFCNNFRPGSFQIRRDFYRWHSRRPIRISSNLSCCIHSPPTPIPPFIYSLTEELLNRRKNMKFSKKKKKVKVSCSVVSDSLQSHELQPARLLCPWNSPGKNTGVGCQLLLQGIVPTQGLNKAQTQTVTVMTNKSFYHFLSISPFVTWKNMYSCDCLQVITEVRDRKIFCVTQEKEVI